MKRTTEIGPFQGEDGRLYPPTEDDIARELIGLSFALARWGGYLTVVPKRVHYQDTDKYEHVGWVVTYNSGGAPAVNVPEEPLAHEAPEQPGQSHDLELPEPPLPEPPVEPEVVAEPEPALAE